MSIVSISETLREIEAELTESIELLDGQQAVKDAQQDLRLLAGRLSRLALELDGAKIEGGEL